MPRCLLLLACTCALLSGCGGGGAPPSGNVFRFHNGAEPETLDPAKMGGVPDVRACSAMLQGLVRVNPDDPRSITVVPGMAESWEISPDQLTYTFHVRQASWSNGDPITAHDFQYSWKRLLTPGVGAIYTDQMRYIRNAMPYFERKVEWQDVGIKVPDDRTLVVQLNHPCPFFLSLVAMFPYYPVNRRTVEEHGDRWTRPENYVSNGPFLLKEWLQNDRIVVERNPYYWNPDEVKLDRVEIYASDNVDTNLNMFLAGETDWVTDFPVTRSQELLALPTYHGGDALGTNFYRFNTTRKPLDDVRVRQALNMAIDKERIVKFITRCGEKPADHITPPTIMDYTPPQGPGYDVEKARQLLADAGFPGGRGFPTLTLLYNTSENHKSIAQAVQSMWKENLGITIELVNREWKVFLWDVRKLDYDIARGGWIADYPDVNTFVDIWRSDTMDTLNNNNTGWRNADFDALVERANQETDRARRAQLFAQAEALMLSEMPIAPLYFYVNKNLVQPRVGGWRDTAWNYHPLETLSIVGGAMP